MNWIWKPCDLNLKPGFNTHPFNKEPVVKYLDGLSKTWKVTVWTSSQVQSDLCDGGRKITAHKSAASKLIPWENPL